jgi:hypothetical protein
MAQSDPSRLGGAVSRPLRLDRECPWANLDPETEFAAIDALYQRNQWPEERKIRALQLLLRHHREWQHRGQSPHHEHWIVAIEGLLYLRYGIKSR